MENDAEGAACATVNTAHAMSHADAVKPPGGPGRTAVHSENHRLTLAQIDHLCTARLFRVTLGEDEFAAGEVQARLVEEKDYLERKHVFTVQVLVQAAVVVFLVTQK